MKAGFFQRLAIGLLSQVLGHAYAGALPPLFGKLELVEEIDVAQSPIDKSRFKEYPKGGSLVASALGRKVRVLPNDRGGLKYFGYLVGKGKNLKANESYLLEIEYPEDQPRSIIVVNQGNGTNRGFYTGTALGDPLRARYVNTNPESLDIPLTGKFERCQMLMTLQDQFSEIGSKRGAELPEGIVDRYHMTPKDGFWVYIAQFTPEQDPLSHGAAVSKIRLYKAPLFENYALKINYPPDGLPRRHLFFREEMSSRGAGFVDPIDWYVGKAKLMRFLGMNTIGMHLLEFGANQGWDSSKFGGDDWVFQTKYPERWGRIVDLAKTYGLSLLPYYEYAGSKGKNGLGFQRRAIPLRGEDYTHIHWGESARADLTDPDTYEDFRKMLEITIVDLKDRAEFVGAWVRPRASQLPISFADATLARFAQHAKKEQPVTREGLLQDKALYQEYLAWWFEARKEFLDKIRDYLRSSGLKDAMVLYTADPDEPGHIQPPGAGGIVAENLDALENASLEEKRISLGQAVDKRWSYEAQTLPRGTWGKWEWQHAIPPQDPKAYRDDVGVLPTYTFNRAYTVGDPAALEAFETSSGMAMIRHYSLNENMFREEKGRDGKPLDPLGYFVADMERSGPYMMLGEAMAMANGNPTEIGYLAANNFNRTFPLYARNFNAAFLSLPALPSKRLDRAASDADVVVRSIDGGKNGVWLAIVNPTYQSKPQITIQLPSRGRVINAATGEVLVASGDRVRLDFYPCQLVSLRLLPAGHRLKRAVWWSVDQ